MKRETVISVAMCTYNGAPFLKRQLDSIISQDLLPDEVIVCDDGSYDETLPILTTFRKQAPFQVNLVVNHSRLGITRNFEQALRHCSGKYILLADQDDIWRNDKIATLVSSMDSNDQALYAYSDAHICDSDGIMANDTLWDRTGLKAYNNQSTYPLQLLWLLRRNRITGATMIVSHKLRDIAMPIPAEWIHDYWLAALGSVPHEGVAIASRLMTYRQHRCQAIGARKRTLVGKIAASLRSQSDPFDVLATQFSQLLNRCHTFKELNISEHDRVDHCIGMIQAKREHLLTRSKIRASGRFSRIPLLTRESLSGRYGVYSDSWLSVASDIVKEASMTAHSNSG